MIQQLNVTISADRPLDGSVCNENVTFTCHTDHYGYNVQYQWSINYGIEKIVNKTYTIQIFRSVIEISCEIFVKLSGARAIYGQRSINIHHILKGKPLNYSYIAS